MKNILYLIPNYFWGGGQQYIYELSQEILRQRQGKLYYIGREVSICRQKFSELGTFQSLPLKSVLDLYSIFRIGYFLCRHHIDVVHAHIPKDALIALLAKLLFHPGTKVIMTRHLVRPGKFNILYRWAYKHIDRYIFVSQTAEQGFFDSCPDPQQLKINNCVIYNSVLDRRPACAPLNLREKYHLRPSTRIISFAGRLARDKGPGILIEAFGQIQAEDTVLVFAGDIEANYVPFLNETLQQCPITDKIFFHPYVENIYDFFGETDIVVVPSIVKESFSLVTLEAMRAGKAIITTNNGAQKEIVEDGKEALLVPPADATALSEAIRKLLADPELQKKLGQNARQKSEAFSYNEFFKKMCAVYGLD